MTAPRPLPTADTRRASPGADRAARAAAEAVARRSYGKLVALLAARTRDVTAAEDALAEAFAAALVAWPAQGVPRSPEGWLSTVARRKWIDAARRRRRAEEAGGHLRLLADELAAAAGEGRALPDERLPLLFACAHPALDPGVRAPLILQAVLGFDAATIGSAFLVPPATMSQRLVRAKRKIRDAGIPFHVPEGADVAARLDAVLDAIHAAFAMGGAEPAGAALERRNLAGDAIWLGRLVVSLLPEEPEALGLLARMLYARSRWRAERDAAGAYVPLAEQDPAAWDAAAIEEAEALLARARALPGPDGHHRLAAAVEAAHAARRHTGRTDWPAIARLYDALLPRAGSPAVAVERALARAEVYGPPAGLAALDALAGDPRVAGYPPYWAARAGLLARAHETGRALAAYGRAIGLERDPAVRRFFERRRSETARRNP